MPFLSQVLVCALIMLTWAQLMHFLWVPSESILNTIGLILKPPHLLSFQSHFLSPVLQVYGPACFPLIRLGSWSSLFYFLRLKEARSWFSNTGFKVPLPQLWNPLCLSEILAGIWICCSCQRKLTWYLIFWADALEFSFQKGPIQYGTEYCLHRDTGSVKFLILL